jgi:uncharacterized protein YhfF
MSYLPEGCARPDPAALDAFWRQVKQDNPEADLGDDYEARWIGMDDDTTNQILDLIHTQDKVGTFTLPWIVERTDQPTPTVGAVIILIDFDGAPSTLVRLTRIVEVPFGEVTEEHTAIDGTPVRDLSIWKPLHTVYWNAMLEPFGMTVSEEMPVWIEEFELLHPAPRTA